MKELYQYTRNERLTFKTLMFIIRQLFAINGEVIARKAERRVKAMLTKRSKLAKRKDNAGLLEDFDCKLFRWTELSKSEKQKVNVSERVKVNKGNESVERENGRKGLMEEEGEREQRCNPCTKDNVETERLGQTECTENNAKMTDMTYPENSVRISQAVKDNITHDPIPAYDVTRLLKRVITLSETLMNRDQKILHLSQEQKNHKKSFGILSQNYMKQDEANGSLLHRLKEVNIQKSKYKHKCKVTSCKLKQTQDLCTQLQSGLKEDTLIARLQKKISSLTKSRNSSKQNSY